METQPKPKIKRNVREWRDGIIIGNRRPTAEEIQKHSRVLPGEFKNYKNSLRDGFYTPELLAAVHGVPSSTLLDWSKKMGPPPLMTGHARKYYIFPPALVQDLVKKINAEKKAYQEKHPKEPVKSGDPESPKLAKEWVITEQSALKTISWITTLIGTKTQSKKDGAALLKKFSQLLCSANVKFGEGE